MKCRLRKVSWMKALRILAVTTIVFMLGAGITIQAQAPCKKNHEVYECDCKAFRTLLDKSQTVAIRHGNMDRFTGVQLKELAKSLGKTVVEDNADLGFEVVPIDSNGFVVGPSDTAIAELRIYAKAPMSERYMPVWVEHYEGEPDRPWASSVHSLIEQFQDHLKHSK